MKLVMTLLVRNEEDIIEANIDFHLSQGVDFIVITDNASDDKTPELLQKYVAAGKAHVITEPQDDYSQDVWVTRMARMAAVDYSADWVINNDADEFWWPKTGTLRDVFSSIGDEINVVEAHRYNFPPIKGSNNNMPFWQRSCIREVVSKNAVGNILPPKTAHRAFSGVSVAQGNHSVSFDQIPVKMLDFNPMVIFHYPMRSYEQFESKIKLGGAAYERNTRFSPQVGITWRSLYEGYKQNNLIEYYFKEELTDDLISSGINSGIYVRDIRLCEYLDNIFV